MLDPENIRGSGDKLVSELSIICHLLKAQKSGPGQAEAPLSRQGRSRRSVADFTDS
jgi:hypothetical protein